MSDNDLTPTEKVEMLAIKDHFSSKSPDAKFYELLQTLDGPNLLTIDEGIRKAIVKYIPEYWDRLQRELLAAGVSDDIVITAAMTVSLLKGYELGRRMQRPLTAGTDKPK